MNLRTTAILFALLCGSILTFGMFQWLGVKTPAQRRADEQVVLPNLRRLVKPPEQDSDGSSNIITKAQYQQFDRLTIDRPARDGKPAETIEIRRRGSQWHIVAPHPVRTSTEAVHLLIDQMALAERETRADLSEGLAAYGLDQPTHVIRLYQGDLVHSLSIGKPGPMMVDPATKQQRPWYYYVVGSERPDAPMTVSAATIPQLLAPLAAFRERLVFPQASRAGERNLPGVPSPLLKELELGGTGRTSVKLAVAATDPRGGLPTRWKFTEPRLGDADLATVAGITNAFSGLRLAKDEDFLRDGVTEPAELEKYGLAPGKAIYSISLKSGLTNNEATETLLVGNPIHLLTAEQFSQWNGANLAAQALAALQGHDANPLAALTGLALLNQRDTLVTGYYATVAGSGSIVRLDEQYVPVLRRPVDEIRSKHLTRLDLDKLDAIDITAGPDTIQLRRRIQKPDGTATAEWDMYVPGKGKLNVDQTAVKELIDALNQIDVIDLRQFLNPETPHVGLDRPAGVITLWEGGIDRDADGKPKGTEPTFKKDAQPAAKLTLSRKLALLPWGSKEGHVFVKREAPDQLPTLLSLPDPWYGPMPTPPPGQQQSQQPPPVYSLSDLISQVRLRYRDHALLRLPAGQREELLVERGNVKYALVNTAKQEPGKTVEEAWHMKQPIDAPCPKGRVMHLLMALEQLTAKPLVTDQATPAQVEEHGVGTKPWMRIHLKSFADDKKNREEYTLLLGNRTKDTDPHPKHYYARLEFKPREGTPPETNSFIFLVHENWVKSLDYEMRELNIFPVVQNVKLTQAVFTWNVPDKDGKPHTLRLQLAPGEDQAKHRIWNVQSLTDNGAEVKDRFPQADAAKMGLIFSEAPHAGRELLNGLQASRFVVHDGTPTPEQRLDPANKTHPPVLVVELKLGDNTTRTLVLGVEHTLKPEDHPFQAGTYRLAWASTLPKAVFLVPTFKTMDEMLKGPEFFKPAAPPTPPASGR
jgi:hypothetical protein